MTASTSSIIYECRTSQHDAHVVPSGDATVHFGMRAMPKPGPVEETESVGRDSADRTPGMNAVRKQPAQRSVSYAE